MMKARRLRPINSLIIWLFVALISSSMTVSAQGKLDKKVLVTIGNEDVTVKEFMDVFHKNNMNNELLDKKSLEEYLDLYINFRLKVAEAKSLKMDTNSAFVTELAGYRKQLSKPYFTDEKVSEALLAEAYQRKLKDVRASHILILVNKDATPKDTLAAYEKVMKLRDRIMKGEAFADVAMEASEDPSARDREAIPNQRPFRPGNKGDLGYFSVFDMVYPFENGAFNTAVGSVSMPIRSEFGYHLIKVTEVSDALGSIEVAHIYVGVNPGASEAEVAEKQEKIDKIYQKIQDSISFEEAVKQYSEDRGSASRDGKLSKFTVNRIVPEFVETVKKMEPGQVSKPVRTMYGFHIIKLIGVERPGSFETEKAALKERISKDARSKKSEEVVIDQIKKDAKYKLNDKAVGPFMLSLDTTLTHGTFSDKSFEGRTDKLFKLGKKSYTLGEFAAYMAKNQRKQEGMTPEAYGYKLLNEFVKESCIAYENDQLEKKYPEFAALMREYRDGILLFDLMDKKVWTYAVKDTAGLRNFYNQNTSKYMWGERVDATLFTITKADEVDKVKHLVESLPDDGAIAKRFDQDSLKSVRIQPGKFERGDNRFIDAAEWKDNSLSVQHSDVDNFTVLVKIRKVLAPQPKALDEAKGIITSDYQNYLEKAWVDELKTKYPVVINKDLLEQVKATY